MKENNEKENKKPKKNKKKKKSFKVIKIILIVILSVILLSGVAAAGVTLAMIKSAPSIDLEKLTDFSEPSIVYDDEGQFMDKVVTEVDREVVTLDDIPDTLENAFISIEDERFRTHKGIDIKRIFGSALIDIKNKLTGVNELQGASTITQQLLKNTILTNDTTITRKVQEMYLAVQLEKILTKDQILESYLNVASLGGNAIGVEAGAYQYFGKGVSDLSLLECAFLAGVTQSPTSYFYSAYNYTYPTDETDNSNLTFKDRTSSVIEKMYENEYISEDEKNQALKDLEEDNLKFNFSSIESDKLNYEWFTLPVIQQVKEDLISEYGYTDDEVNTILINDGLQIYSTMDKSLQDKSQEIMNDPSYYGANTVDENGISQPQSSAVIFNYHTGEAKVIIGGRGDQPALSFNRAAYTGYSHFTVPVGSSIKPLTVYSPAIDTKTVTAGTVIEDSPLPIEQQKLLGTNGKLYNPQNYTKGSYRGYTTIRYGLAMSLNTIAVKTEQMVGNDTAREYGKKYGLDLSDTEDFAASLSLGELSQGSNTMTMAAAYGVFGNNGVYTPPRLYTKVVDKTGKTLLEGPTKEPYQVITPQSAYVMWDLLKGPVSYGTAAGLSIGGMPIGGKTGTSEKDTYYWFCGLSPYYSGAVYIGNDTPANLRGVVSSGSTSRLWAALMTEANKDLEKKDITRPSGLVSVTICKDSGKIPTDLCSKDERGSRVYTELFIQGTQPTSLCDVHVEIEINKLNGLLATENTPLDLLLKKIFITRDYKPTVTIADQKYVVPTKKDDTKAIVEPKEPEEPDTSVDGDADDNPPDDGIDDDGDNSGASDGTDNDDPPTDNSSVDGN
ncbi:MAG: transglycosylase domain-containing protein [Clostridiaceae bacterium]